MTDRSIEYVALSELSTRRAPGNPKAHHAEIIERSVSRFGFVEPIVIDERTGLLVAGHGRLDDIETRKDRKETVPEGLRISEEDWLVPVIRGWASKNDDEANAYLVVSNQATILGGWDEQALADLLGSLKSSDPVSFEATGFTDAGLEALLSSLEAARPEPEEEPKEFTPLTLPEVPVTQRGDVWLIGDHRFMCGDCRDKSDVDTLLGGAAINLGFTSPPYAEQRDYDESSGFTPIPADGYVEWFEPVAANVAASLVDDGSWFVNIKPAAKDLDTDLYVFDLVVAHVREWEWHFVTEFCWERTGVPKAVTRRFKNQFEPVYQFARGDFKIRPDAVRHASADVPVALGPGGSIGRDASLAGNQGGTGNALIPPPARKRGTAAHLQGVGPSAGGNLFNEDERTLGLAYPGNRLPSFAGTHEATGHPAAFPVGLPAHFIRAYTDEGDKVFDPFGGSGSTLLAAHESGRVGFLMELSPGYLDLALARIQRVTGLIPVLESSGEEVSFG